MCIRKTNLLITKEKKVKEENLLFSNRNHLQKNFSPKDIFYKIGRHMNSAITRST